MKSKVFLAILIFFYISSVHAMTFYELLTQNPKLAQDLDIQVSNTKEFTLQETPKPNSEKASHWPLFIRKLVSVGDPFVAGIATGYKNDSKMFFLKVTDNCFLLMRHPTALGTQNVIVDPGASIRLVKENLKERYVSYASNEPMSNRFMTYVSYASYKFTIDGKKGRAEMRYICDISADVDSSAEALAKALNVKKEALNLYKDQQGEKTIHVKASDKRGVANEKEKSQKKD